MSGRTHSRLVCGPGLNPTCEDEMNIRTDSTEYVYSTVTADHDLTGVLIEVALPATGNAPVTGDWHSAETTGVTQTSMSPARWTATYRILLGPSGGVTSLVPGNYDWTVRLTDSPEHPVRKTGSVIVTLI